MPTISRKSWWKKKGKYFRIFYITLGKHHFSIWKAVFAIFAIYKSYMLKRKIKILLFFCWFFFTVQGVIRVLG